MGGELSHEEKRHGEKCLMGRNVIWGEMLRGEMSWGEMLRGELSFGVKCYRAAIKVSFHSKNCFVSKQKYSIIFQYILENGESVTFIIFKVLFLLFQRLCNISPQKTIHPATFLPTTFLPITSLPI